MRLKVFGMVPLMVAVTVKKGEASSSETTTTTTELPTSLSGGLTLTGACVGIATSVIIASLTWIH